MKIERGFLLSLYVNLALAVACLAYVTLPSYSAAAWVLAGPFLVLFVVAFLVEGRWSLNTFWSNVLPLVIAAGAGLYFADLLIHLPAGERQSASTFILALQRAPLVLFVVLIAILFRPKTITNYWMLQFLGFTMAILAAALESDFLFGFFLTAYLVSALWTLACFFLYREHIAARAPIQASEPPVQAPAAPGAQAARGAVLPWRWLGLLQAGRRALAIGAAALILYIFTPRHTVASWEERMFGSPLLQSGLGGSFMDLNRRGTIRINRAVAFEVEAHTADGKPKLDLDLSSRWRAKVLTHYENGRWQLPAERPVLLRAHSREVLAALPDVGLPDVGPDQFLLTFHFAAPFTHLPVVAEPLATGPGEPVPVIFTFQSGTRLHSVWQADGELAGAPELRERRFACKTYRQVMRPGVPPGTALAREPDGVYVDRHCETPDLPELKRWTDRLLERLVEQRQLQPADIRPDAAGRLPAASHEKVARALEAHLRASGEYAYSLVLLRDDRRADPVVDFLCNVKLGHCERFASGLALMLRCEGVPARIVTGFRGADSLNNGTYRVRHSNAHSWVEVLVQRRIGDWRWLTLDPTPGEEQANAGAGLGRWWRDFRQGGGSFWRNYVVEFSGEEQQTLQTELLSRLGVTGPTEPAASATPESEKTWGTLEWAALVSILLGLFLLGHRLRRWWRKPLQAPPKPEIAFYFRFLKLLARRCDWEPGAAQTAQEFAGTIARRLQEDPATAPLADVPPAIAALFYRARYSGRPLTETEIQTIELQLAELDKVLRKWDPVPATVANQPIGA
jgi:hypothetical protein